MISTAGIASAQDCCALCQATANCRGTFFYNSNGGKVCYQGIGDTCDAGQFHTDDFYTTRASTQPGQYYTIGNGPCGGLRNKGSA